jgi:hypothetical protein
LLLLEVCGSQPVPSVETCQLEYPWLQQHQQRTDLLIPCGFRSHYVLLLPQLPCLLLLCAQHYRQALLLLLLAA